MSNVLQNKGSQMYQFDVLRGIAILGVFFVHYQYAIFQNFDFVYGRYFVELPKYNDTYKYLSMSPFAFGWMGVTLFFLISGFLIHYITLKKGIDYFNLKLYFNKRFWRIYPPYLLALLFFIFAQNNIHHIIYQPKDFISS